jgi:hypothetical protein
MRRLVLIATVAGCGYHPGTFADFHGPFAGTRETIGCVEVAVGAGDADVHAEGPVIAYGFGNRCHHPVTLDLASVRAVGRDAAGVEHALVAYDPAGEIRPMPLDGLWSGREQIEYVLPPGARSLVSVCVDVGGVDATAPRAERWVCTDHHVEQTP